jgi:hypothetical protein
LLPPEQANSFKAAVQKRQAHTHNDKATLSIQQAVPDNDQGMDLMDRARAALIRSDALSQSTEQFLAARGRPNSQPLIMTSAADKDEGLLERAHQQLASTDAVLAQPDPQGPPVSQRPTPF